MPFSRNCRRLPAHSARLAVSLSTTPPAVAAARRSASWSALASTTCSKREIRRGTVFVSECARDATQADAGETGEIAAISNCTSILTSPSGRYRLSAAETLEAFKHLSLYTNGEPCPMCASAIRWAGLKECIYGTTIDTLGARGWNQIQVYSHEIFQRSTHLPGRPRLIGPVLANETDAYFSWQFEPSHHCPP